MSTRTHATTKPQKRKKKAARDSSSAGANPSVTLTQIERALWVVDQSDVAAKLDQAVRVSTRGRKRTMLTTRLYLALMIVAGMQGKWTAAAMFDIATRQLPNTVQLQLGIRRPRPGGGVDILTKRPIENLHERISKHLAWTGPYAEDLSHAERDRREQLLLEICLMLHQTTLIVPRQGGAFAVDETGIWAWTKMRRSAAGLPPAHPQDEDPTATVEDDWRGADDTDADEDENESVSTTTNDAVAPTALIDVTEELSEIEPAEDATEAGEVKKREPHPLDWDARVGTKTAKNGTKVRYYGYAVHAFVRAADRRNTQYDRDLEPKLVERFRVTPASTDVVDLSLDMIDHMIATGTPVTEIIGDRHYSYKRMDRWALQMWKRGISLVHDLRDDDSRKKGAVDYLGSKVIDSVPHCPSTPEHLERLVRPGITASDKEKKRYATLIEEREHYAMKRHAAINAYGKSRWTCPLSTLGCPLKEGSIEVAHELGLPIVANPPAKPTPFCEQTTVQVPPIPAMKYAQDDYWGSPGWENSWKRRTVVEGVFGRIKNRNTGNVARGYFQVVGLPLVTLAITAAIVAYNIEELNTWHDRTGNGDPNHPLLKTTEWVNGFEMLTAEQAAQIDADFLGAPAQLPNAA